jgi:hypothetical protein
VALAAALLVSCAGRATGPAATSGPAATTGVEGTDIPDAVQILCDTGGTTVQTPVARPQRDGVHFEIRNTSGRDLGFEIGDVGGDNAPSGSSEVVWPVPPGDVEVGCVDDTGSDSAAPLPAVTVQDADGIWTDPAVGCDSAAGGSFDYAADSPGAHGNLVDIALRRIADQLREGDHVEPAGYPDAPERHVIVVRDGTTVADLTYVRDRPGTGWLEDSETSCEDFVPRP